MKAIRLLIVLGVLNCGAQASIAQTGHDALPTLFNHLYTGTDSLIELGLDTDLRLLIRRKHQEEYQPAIFSFSGPGGLDLSWEAKIRSRGNIRKSVCYYPPIRLNVKKGNLETIGFSESDKIKVVLQCRKGQGNVEYLLQEYLIYKMYNLLDTVSYRVQLARFTFTDPEGKRDPQDLLGFLIEPLEDLAQRVGGQIVERESAAGTMMESHPYNVMTTFQYMVGNTDWSPANMHNLSTVKLPDERKMHAIPYDFDYTGMVNAHYAVPAENSALKSVRQRFYNGQACTDAEARYVINLFREKKEALLDTVRDFPLLDEREKHFTLDYLEEFFQMLEHEKTAMNLLQRKY